MTDSEWFYLALLGCLSLCILEVMWERRLERKQWREWARRAIPEGRQRHRIFSAR